MLDIFVISDTHNCFKEINADQLNFIDSPYTFLIHGGDLSIRGTPDQIKSELKEIAKFPAKHKLVIPGNHDFDIENEPTYYQEFAQELGIHLLINDTVVLENIVFHGIPHQPYFHDWAFNYSSSHDKYLEQASYHMSKVPDDVNILITHGPPYKILDKVRYPRRNEDPHVGCKILLEKTKSLKELKYHIFGHIHESYGKHIEPKTTYLNAAYCLLNSDKDRRNQPHEIRYENI